MFNVDDVTIYLPPFRLADRHLPPAVTFQLPHLSASWIRCPLFGQGILTSPVLRKAAPHCLREEKPAPHALVAALRSPGYGLPPSQRSFFRR